jgi:hypothetical protein
MLQLKEFQIQKRVFHAATRLDSNDDYIDNVSFGSSMKTRICFAWKHLAKRGGPTMMKGVHRASPWRPNDASLVLQQAGISETAAGWWNAPFWARMLIKVCVSRRSAAGLNRLWHSAGT